MLNRFDVLSEGLDRLQVEGTIAFHVNVLWAPEIFDPLLGTGQVVAGG